jgi:nucleotide-binding universal stress UspA family protein
MRTRVTTRVEPALVNGHGPVAMEMEGVAVLEAAPGAVPHIERMLDSGVGELLWLPNGARLPGRVLIHCVDDAARAGTLAVAASLLRHLSAEAIYFVISPSGAKERSIAVRQLLDTRAVARGVQGLDVRTELLDGDAAEQLALRLAAEDVHHPDTMLILGTQDARAVAQSFERLLATPECPVLVVHRPGGQNPEWETPRARPAERSS